MACFKEDKDTDAKFVRPLKNIFNRFRSMTDVSRAHCSCIYSHTETNARMEVGHIVRNSLVLISLLCHNRQDKCICILIDSASRAEPV